MLMYYPNIYRTILFPFVNNFFYFTRKLRTKFMEIRCLWQCNRQVFEEERKPRDGSVVSTWWDSSVVSEMEFKSLKKNVNFNCNLKEKNYMNVRYKWFLWCWMTCSIGYIHSLVPQLKVLKLIQSFVNDL